MLVVVFAVDAQKRRAGLVDQTLRHQRQARRGFENFFQALCRENIRARVEQARRPHQVLRCGQSQRWAQPLFLKGPVHAGAPIDRAAQPLGLGVRQLGRPVAAEAAAHASDALAVDITPRGQIIHRRGKGSLGLRLVAQTRILPSAGHVDGEAGDADLEQHVIVGAAVFFPTVDAAPVHDDWRPMDALGHLQIANDFFAFEGNLTTLQRRIHIGRGLEKGAQRALVAGHFLRAARHRVAADAIVLVGEIESFAGFILLPLFCLVIAQRFVLGAELAPLAPPQI